MRTIEVDDDLYLYIASQTQHIGESASDILRRLLNSSKTSSEQISVDLKRQQVSTASLSRGPAVAKVEPMHVIQSMLNSDEFTKESRAVGRFMMLLTCLYQIDKNAFSEAAELKGRKRVYLSRNKEVLLASGNTTKPRQIQQTPYWVITNTNTNRKQQIVQHLMEKMHFQQAFIEKIVTSI